MPLRKLLLASVATPVLALSAATVPVHARDATAPSVTSQDMPLLLAQTEGDAPVEEEAKPAPAAEDAKPEPKAAAPEEKAVPPEEKKPAPDEKPASEPKAEPAPAEKAAPEPKAEQAAPEPKAEPAPAEKPAPKPKAEPAPAEEPKADQAPAAEAAPEPKPEAAPDAEAESKPAEEPAPDTDPSAAQQPEPKAEPAPAAKDEAAPEPKPVDKGDKADKQNADQAEPDSTVPAQPDADTKDESGAAPKDEPKKKKRAEPAPENDGSAAESESQPETSAPDDAGAQDRNAEDGKRTGGKKRRRNRDRGNAETPEETAPASKADNNGEGDNTAAQSNAGEEPQPEMLEVPNGAPVLDSAKDSRSADENAGDNNGDRRKRRERRRLKAGTPPPPPGVDFDESRDNRRDYRRDVEIRPADNERGKRRRERPEFRLPDNFDVRDRSDGRVILQFGNRTIIQNDDNGRLARRSRDVYYEDLPGGHTRQVVTRPNGVKVVTIRNRRGTILQRSRFGRNGRETVLIYAPDYDRGDHDTFRDPGEYLPPLRITEPVDEYILDATSADESDYVRFLNQPPVEDAERVYTLDEVKYSARVRDKLPRVDLDTITFETGSAAIGPDGIDKLVGLADALDQIINDDPSETFLIEGHTDAVGSNESNLLLSDQRAESVAEVLTEEFEVPPENLVTQGYGERYLKVDTEGAERLNRRVTVRRITPLVRPVAQN